MEVTNWGRYPKVEATFKSAKFESDFQRLLEPENSYIARGNGRCYGDSSLNENIISSLPLNKIRHFNPNTGEIRCQAGVTLTEIIDFALPKGFFIPVTPGTKLITVGGALAADIHGKNHHVDGSFVDHVNWFTLLSRSGEYLRCSRSEHSDLFFATAGGMGLTGIISEVSFNLKKVETGYIRQKNIKAPNLQAIMELFEANTHYTYSVAWLDCLQKGKSLGRSILMLGEHAKAEELSASQQKAPLKLHGKGSFLIPEFFPSFLLNNLSIKAFNFLYYHKQFQKTSEFYGDYNSFFYPLDMLLEWNRLYGKTGFTQYQFVLPLESSKEGLTAILNRIAKLNLASFLTVLKLFGKNSHPEYLSFPQEGYTLALDFKIVPGIFEKLDELDRMVLDFGGKLYLAKDSRMKAQMFHESYPNLQNFQEVLKKYEGKYSFRSRQSNRLNLIS